MKIIRLSIILCSSKKLIFLVLLFTACQSGTFENPHHVQHKGELKQMMKSGDISAKGDLKELANLSHVYALGAVENLKGEKQVFHFDTFKNNSI